MPPLNQLLAELDERVREMNGLMAGMPEEVGKALAGKLPELGKLNGEAQALNAAAGDLAKALAARSGQMDRLLGEMEGLTEKLRRSQEESEDGAAIPWGWLAELLKMALAALAALYGAKLFGLF